MRSNVNALEIQCKRPRNTGSGKFQRGPRAVKISRYIHQPSFSQEPTMMVKESDDDDDDDDDDGRRRSSFKIVLYIGPLSPESLPEAFFL